MEKFYELSLGEKVISGGYSEGISREISAVSARITESYKARISEETATGFSGWIPVEIPGHTPAGIFNAIPKEIIQQILVELL